MVSLLPLVGSGKGPCASSRHGPDQRQCVFYPSPWNESSRTRNILHVQCAETVHQSDRHREWSARSDTTMWHGHRCRIPCSTRIFSDQATRATGEKGGVAGVARICRDTFHPKLKQVRIVGRCHMEPAGPGSREPDQRWPRRPVKYGYLKTQIQPQNGKDSAIRAAAKSRAAPPSSAAKDRPSPAGAGKDYSAGQQGGKGLLSRAADHARAAGQKIMPGDLQQAIRHWKRQGGRMPTTQGRQGGAGITLRAGLLLC